MKKSLLFLFLTCALLFLAQKTARMSRAVGKTKKKKPQ